MPYSKYIYTLFCGFLCSVLLSQGQRLTSVGYEATYSFSCMIDTLRDEKRTFDFVLLNHELESRFHSTNKQYNDSMSLEFVIANPSLNPEPETQEEAQAFADAFMANMNTWRKTNIVNYKIKKDFSKHLAMIDRPDAFPPQHLEESLEFNWQLTEAQDSIAGLLCYQATTSYGGRHYTAWYAPEIPIADGPYVFCGLPGLIVQIADEREWFQFRLKSIQTNPGPRFWSKDYFNPTSQVIDRKTYVDKSVEEKNNPSFFGILDVTEEMLLQAKQAGKWMYFMLLEWY